MTGVTKPLQIVVSAPVPMSGSDGSLQFSVAPPLIVRGLQKFEEEEQSERDKEQVLSDEWLLEMEQVGKVQWGLWCASKCSGSGSGDSES